MNGFAVAVGEVEQGDLVLAQGLVADVKVAVGKESGSSRRAAGVPRTGRPRTWPAQGGSAPPPEAHAGQHEQEPHGAYEPRPDHQQGPDPDRGDYLPR